MQKHTKNYFRHYKFAEDEFIPCQVCNAEAVDIHHIIHRSAGGSDEVDNLIALCRECHMKAHYLAEPYISTDELFEVINTKIETQKTTDYEHSISR